MTRVLFGIIFLSTLLCNKILKAEESAASTTKEQAIEYRILEKIKSFCEKYAFQDENPIFKDKKKMIGVMYTYDFEFFRKNNIVINEGEKVVYSEDTKPRRQLETLSAHFSLPNKIFSLNGRFSFGIFSMFGKEREVWRQTKYESVYIYSMQADLMLVGVEAFQELVIGRPMFYITFGVGVSYMRGKNGLKEGFQGLTYFNFVPIASIGHRFDNGFALEIVYKHYSNGNDYNGRNKGVNSLGLAIKYAF